MTDLEFLALGLTSAAAIAVRNPRDYRKHWHAINAIEAVLFVHPDPTDPTDPIATPAAARRRRGWRVP